MGVPSRKTLPETVLRPAFRYRTKPRASRKRRRLREGSFLRSSKAATAP